MLGILSFSTILSTLPCLSAPLPKSINFSIAWLPKSISSEIQTSALPLNSDLWQGTNFSGLQFYPLRNEDDNACLIVRITLLFTRYDLENLLYVWRYLGIASARPHVVYRGILC